MSFQVGDVVDHYRLDEVVAHHASVTVHAAFDLRLLRRVALNELPPAGGAARARFTREAAAAAQLDHPSVIPVYDSNEHDGSLYYVTKFVDGVPLADLQRVRAPTVAEAMIYLDQLASGLDYIHRRGVTHGNVRPSTILVATDELPHSALLFDVGITTQIDDGSEALRWSQAQPVTGEAERRADMIGLARTAFELLTRRAPEDAMVSASTIDRQLPSAVDEVFAGVLQGDHDATCAQFVGALRRVLPAELLVYRPPLLAGSAAPDPAPHTDLTSAPAPARSSSGLLAVSIVAALVLVVGAVWWQGSGTTRADGAVGRVVATTVAETAAATTAPPPTSAAPTTEPATTVETTAVPTTVAPTTVTAPALNPDGAAVGQTVTAGSSVQGDTALALQARSIPDDVADVDTPAAFYAQWLRLLSPPVAAPVAAPVVATADGYAIDAGGPADLTTFELNDSGRVTAFTECIDGACNALADAIRIEPDCAPGPECHAFATADGRVLGVLRATVLTRLPSITLLFKLSSKSRAVADVSDPTSSVRWDADTGYLGLTLPSAPPAGTETAVTITYADGGRSTMTITWGSQ